LASPGVNQSHAPQQDGIVERLFRSLKEVFVWQHSFGNFTEAAL
jgi:hypothetical protein